MCETEMKRHARIDTCQTRTQSKTTDINRVRNSCARHKIDAIHANPIEGTIFISNIIKSFLFSSFFLQVKPDDINQYLKWLCAAPRTTTIRMNTLKGRLDEIQQHIVNNGKQTMAKPLFSDFAAIPHVLLIENKCDAPAPECDRKEIIVDCVCGAAVLRGAHIYSPGVLAMQTNTKINEIVNVYADVDAVCKKGTRTVNESTRKIFLGIGCVKMQRYQLYSNNPCTRGIAIEMIKTVSGVPSIGDDFIPSGKAVLQNLPSIVCSLVVDPQPNEIILDMCAAPGNKTTHLAQLMQNRGSIIALDKSNNRVSLLRKNIQQFGAECAQAFVFDATKCISDDTRKTIDNDDRLKPPFNREMFDRVLLDAPCSGFGNRPQLANSMTSKMQKSYPAIQQKLLDVAVQLLKPGGILVYSTCTIFPSENEANVKWILNRNENGLDLIAAEPFHGGPGWPNVELTERERALVQRFGPENDPLRAPSGAIFNDTVAFFIAKFQKK